MALTFNVNPRVTSFDNDILFSFDCFVKVGDRLCFWVTAQMLALVEVVSPVKPILVGSVRLAVRLRVEFLLAAHRLLDIVAGLPAAVFDGVVAFVVDNFAAQLVLHH